MGRVDTKEMQLLLRRCQIGLSVLLGVVRDFQLALGNRALVIKNLGSFFLRPRQSLVIDRLQVLIEGVGDVGALHLHEQLALLDVGADLGMNRNHTAGGYRNDRDGSGNIRIDRAGHVERRGRRILRSCRYGKAVGMIDCDEGDTALIHHLHGRRGLSCFIMLLAAATAQHGKTESGCDKHRSLHE